MSGTNCVSEHERAYCKTDAASRFVAAAIGCLALLVGCASQSATAPPPQPTVSTQPPTAAAPLSPELCAAAAQYQNAANAIVNLDAKQVGTDGVKKALQDLEVAANNLAAAAQEQFGPQVAELNSAVASLRATIAGLSDQDSLSTNLGKIAASVSVVEQAAKPIMDSLEKGCPAVPRAVTPPTS